MNRITRISGVLAGIATLLIGVAILGQILLRLMGFYLPGAVEISTFAMVAAVFLGLPYTFATRGHIRVTLFARRVRVRGRLRLELGSRMLALVWVAYMDYWTFDLVMRSFDRGSMTSGLVAIPLWIPQLLMPLGLTLFGLSILHSLFGLLGGKEDLSDIFDDSEL